MASWTHLEKTGVPSKVNSWMQRTQKSLLTFASCLSPEGLMYFCHPHPILDPRTFEQFWGQGSHLIYYCFFCNNQHHDWHVNGAALLCRDASYFLPFHLTLDTTPTKHWSRWWAHPKWGCYQWSGWAHIHVSKMSHQEITKKKTNIDRVEPFVCRFWVILLKEH